MAFLVSLLVFATIIGLLYILSNLRRGQIPLWVIVLCASIITILVITKLHEMEKIALLTITSY